MLGPKVTVQAHVKPWITPEKIHFDEGLKLPVNGVEPQIVEFLIRRWLDDVCGASGLEYEFKVKWKDAYGVELSKSIDNKEP